MSYQVKQVIPGEQQPPLNASELSKPPENYYEHIPRGSFSSQGTLHRFGKLEIQTLVDKYIWEKMNEQIFYFSCPALSVLYYSVVVVTATLYLQLSE